jgi:hypothetical protein
MSTKALQRYDFSLTTLRQPDLVVSRHFRVEEIPETVAEQIEAKHGHRDGPAGEDRVGRAEGQEVLSFLEHETPRWVRRLVPSPRYASPASARMATGKAVVA